MIMKYNIAPMLNHIKLTGEFEIKAGSAVLLSEVIYLPRQRRRLWITNAKH